VSCAFIAAALSASAQGAVQGHQAHAPGVHHDVPANAPAPAAGQTRGRDWISSASAGSADVPLHAGARAMRDKQDSAPEQGHSHHTRPAMLIAALAVMTAIALRRLSASDS
jgi:hypothetical protein